MWTGACETLASKLCAPCVRAGILSQVGFSSSLIERPMDAVAMSALARGDYGHEGNAVGILDRYGTGRKTAMHGIEWRRLATGTLAEFDHGHADAIAELGCPTRVASRAWWDEREGAGEGDGGAWLSQESREALRVGRRVSVPERRGRWVRSRSPGGRSPRGEGTDRHRARGENRHPRCASLGVAGSAD